MIITKIECESPIYTVTFSPSVIERIFGIKEVTKRFKKTSGTYSYGGGGVYVNEKGETLSNGNWIAKKLDAWNRRF